MICRICGKKIEQVENITDIKADVNKYYRSPAKLKKIDADFGFCKECDLGQIDYLLDDAFYDGYLMGESGDTNQSDRGVSTYYEGYYNLILQQLGEMSDGERLLDIGCGVGTVLKIARKYFDNVCGIEPSAEACEIAKRAGLDVDNGYFDNSYDKDNFSAITATQVLEHLNNPKDVIKTMYDSLKWGGVVYVDVPNGKRVYTDSRYYDVYLEHINYWSIYSLSKIFATSGFSVVDAHEIHNGNHIMLLAQKKKEHVPFASVHRGDRDKLFDILSRYETVSVWGCGVKGSVFVRGIDSERIKYFFDSDEQLDGKYVDDFKLPIFMPDESKINANELILITATEHKSDIEDMLRNKFGYNGDIISIDEM